MGSQSWTQPSHFHFTSLWMYVCAEKPDVDWTGPGVNPLMESEEAPPHSEVSASMSSQDCCTSWNTCAQLDSPNPSRLPLEMCKSTTDLSPSWLSLMSPNSELTSEAAFYYPDGNEEPEKKCLPPCKPIKMCNIWLVCNYHLSDQVKLTVKVRNVI